MFDEKTKELIKKKYNYIYNILDEFEYMHYSLINYNDNNRKDINYKYSYISNEDIITLAKKIIDSLNIDSYSETFDYVIKNNQIKFRKNVDGSRFKPYDLNNRETWEIEIEEKNVYSTVVTLVHEFIHYVSAIIGTQPGIRSLFSEFTSIYFENYAIDYLINNGLDKEELSDFNRAYLTFECLSKALEKREGYFDLNLSDDEYVKKINSYYKHLLGFYMGEWAHKNVEVNKIVELNEKMDNSFSTQQIYDYIGFNNLYRLTDDVIDILKENNKKIR